MKFEKYPIIPAVVTMFDKNGDFDEQAQRKIIRFLLDKKADGFYIGGATGEGFMMSAEERKRLIATCAEEINGKVPAIAYTGMNDTKNAIELSKFAEKCGADAVSSVPPSGFEFADIKKYYADIAASVDIPLVIYTNLTTRQLSIDEILEICSIPNCIGMKYTNHNHYLMRMLSLKMKDKFIFSGADEMIGSSMIAGATGAIGSTYNLTPEIFMDLRDAFLAGDMKRFLRLNEACVCIVDALIRCNFMASMKALLKTMGIGDGVCREPRSSFNRSSQLDPILKEFKTIKEKYDIADVELFNALCK